MNMKHKKKSCAVLKYALPALGAAAAAAGVTAFLVAPGKASGEKKAPFFGANIAHRGLHRADRSVPENSLAAFRDAAENGYAIELDVHLTADDRVVVFHDDSLRRVCGVEQDVEALTWRELRDLRLDGTGEHIPTLSDVLAEVRGRVPIVVELKTSPRRRELCERTWELLRAYNGDYCIESFDPRIVRWWRINAPGVLRGQLSCTREQFGESATPVQAFFLSRLLCNFLGRPQFIAYGLDGKKPLLVRLVEKMGAMRFCWTSHDWKNEVSNDAVIFEFYRPRQRFK